MQRFKVTIRTEQQILRYNAIAPAAMVAFQAASTAMGEVVCSISVVPA